MFQIQKLLAELQIPGGFDAASIYAKLLKEGQSRCKEAAQPNSVEKPDKDEDDEEEEPFRLSSFYISRYQLWNDKLHWRPHPHHKANKCNGEICLK